MATGRRFPRGTEFPAEAFVQQAIEHHFRQLGFVINDTGHIDLRCNHPTSSERWHIEAKGETSAPGLDFRTCLGQLIQRMSDPETHYAIALPDIPRYISQLEAVSPWVVDALRIHWLLVAQDGSVRMLSPSNVVTRDA